MLTLFLDHEPVGLAVGSLYDANDVLLSTLTHVGVSIEPLYQKAWKLHPTHTLDDESASFWARSVEEKIRNLEFFLQRFLRVEDESLVSGLELSIEIQPNHTIFLVGGLVSRLRLHLLIDSILFSVPNPMVDFTPIDGNLPGRIRCRPIHDHFIEFGTSRHLLGQVDLTSTFTFGDTKALTSKDCEELELRTRHSELKFRLRNRLLLEDEWQEFCRLINPARLAAGISHVSPVLNRKDVAPTKCSVRRAAVVSIGYANFFPNQIIAERLVQQCQDGGIESRIVQVEYDDHLHESTHGRQRGLNNIDVQLEIVQPAVRHELGILMDVLRSFRQCESQERKGEMMTNAGRVLGQIARGAADTPEVWSVAIAAAQKVEPLLWLLRCDAAYFARRELVIPEGQWNAPVDLRVTLETLI